MNRIRTGKVTNFNRIMVFLVAMTIGFPFLPGFKTEARASDGAAFLGGMVAGHVIGRAIRRDRIRTAAAVETANQQRKVQQPLARVIDNIQVNLAWPLQP